jgi:hypothetical protein
MKRNVLCSPVDFTGFTIGATVDMAAANITEESTTFGKLVDGIKAPWSQDTGLTPSEAFYCAAGYAAIGWALARRAGMVIPFLG